MNHCQNCGAALKDGASFCNNCGAAQKPRTQNEQSKIHCPNCASRNLSISSEAGGASAFSNADRNFWFCADCGTKFRSIPNLEEEIKKRKTTIVGFFIAAGIFFVLGVWMLFFALDSFFGGLFFGYAFAFLVGTVVCFSVALYYRNVRKKLQAELIYLKENCFN